LPENTIETGEVVGDKEGGKEGAKNGNDAAREDQVA
jgi:hypothetical protein